MDYPQIRWDVQANVAVIAFGPPPRGDRTVLEVSDDDGDLLALVHFAPGGELVELELLDAARQLPADLPARVDGAV
ncbi:hypothetical protein [Actinomadura parmotrematis]|uniref:DUF2283 domain-containing protein n=1 Tax=Actinomadura parmotrematis TaxID=2864039 RepID=A0ABS7FYZ2_9ACTN|nr:hypothetical protein [Actinomadura parmotrematis]MBW8484797.1 hypothetical protein [Actinomadura parmotrematis]